MKRESATFVVVAFAALLSLAVSPGVLPAQDGPAVPPVAIVSFAGAAPATAPFQGSSGSGGGDAESERFVSIGYALDGELFEFGTGFSDLFAERFGLGVKGGYGSESASAGSFSLDVDSLILAGTVRWDVTGAEGPVRFAVYGGAVYYSVSIDSSAISADFNEFGGVLGADVAWYFGADSNWGVAAALDYYFVSLGSSAVSVGDSLSVALRYRF